MTAVHVRKGSCLGQRALVVGLKKGDGLVQDAPAQAYGIAVLPAVRMRIEVIGKLSHTVVYILILQIFPALVGLMVGENRASQNGDTGILVLGGAGAAGIGDDGQACDFGLHAGVGTLKVHKVLHGKFLAVGFPLGHAIGNLIGSAQVVQLQGKRSFSMDSCSCQSTRTLTAT